MGQIETKLWVSAAVRGLLSQGKMACVLTKGDAASGLVALKLRLTSGAGAALFLQERTDDDTLGWFAVQNGAVLPESDADAYLARRTAQDPDLWVIEVESADGRNPFSEMPL